MIIILQHIRLAGWPIFLNKGSHLGWVGVLLVRPLSALFR